MFRTVVAAGCLCAVTAAEAGPTMVSGQEITDLVAGATLEIDTPIGTKIPVRYRLDGRMSGDARDLGSYLGADTDRGRWWVTADQLCHRWERWFSSEPQCLRLWREGRRIHWRSQDGNSGTAAIAVPAPPKVAAVAPFPQPEPKMRVVAPEPTPTPAPAEQVQELPRAPARFQAASEQVKPAAIAAVVPPQPVRVDPAMRPASPPMKSAPATRTEPRPAFIVANVALCDVLNVRSGPSTDFEVVAELEPGSRGITIIGACGPEWCQVQHQSITGWVNRMYLASEEPPSSILSP